MDNENTLAVGFEPAARAELLAMFTGMALQGILANSAHANLGKDVIADTAVEVAGYAVDALEQFHDATAKAAEAKMRADKAAFDAANGTTGDDSTAL